MLTRNSGMEYKEMSLEELQVLGKQCAEGDLEAREKLILSHMGLIHVILSEYIGKGTEAEDLFQEGCYGLIQAVDHYDYRRDTRLSTYAGYWIRKRMKRAVARQNKYLLFNMDPKLLQQLCFYRQCYHQLLESLERCPMPEELADITGYSLQKIHNLNKLLVTFISLDAALPGVPDNCHYHYDSIIHRAEQTISSTEDLAICNLLKADINEAEPCIRNVPLTKREREALRRRLGFTQNGTPESWTAISEATGLSRPTVKHDYLEAIRKVRESFGIEGENAVLEDK